MIERVVVVIPACDEEQTIGAALRAVDVAARRLALPTRVIVVLDGCRDDSLGAVRRTPTDVPVEVVVAPIPKNVGAARALGVAHAALGRPPETTWIASTDADSTVGPDWLTTHVALADAGIGAVVGAVAVAAWTGRPAALPELFHRRYELSSGPAPVHGANLGVRLDAYLAAGGFPASACGEDHALVAALRACGTVVAYTTASPVLTSVRPVSRVRGGFADTLTAWTMPAGPSA